jgi:carboxymethylenebutenolidase
MCDSESCNESTPPQERPHVSRQQRREFLKGLASLPLAVVLADPALAQAAGKSLTGVTHKTSNGIDINAYVALPKQTPAP